MELLFFFMILVSLVLGIFNTISVFVLGSAISRNREYVDKQLKKRIKRGRRYTPDENLLDISNTQYPFDQENREDNEESLDK